LRTASQQRTGGRSIGGMHQIEEPSADEIRAARPPPIERGTAVKADHPVAIDDRQVVVRVLDQGPVERLAVVQTALRRDASLRLDESARVLGEEAGEDLLFLGPDARRIAVGEDERADSPVTPDFRLEHRANAVRREMPVTNMSGPGILEHVCDRHYRAMAIRGAGRERHEVSALMPSAGGDVAVEAALPGAVRRRGPYADAVDVQLARHHLGELAGRRLQALALDHGARREPARHPQVLTQALRGCGEPLLRLP